MRTFQSSGSSGRPGLRAEDRRGVRPSKRERHAVRAMEGNAAPRRLLPLFRSSIAPPRPPSRARASTREVEERRIRIARAERVLACSRRVKVDYDEEASGVPPRFQHIQNRQPDPWRRRWQEPTIGSRTDPTTRDERIVEACGRSLAGRHSHNGLRETGAILSGNRPALRRGQRATDSACAAARILAAEALVDPRR